MIDYRDMMVRYMDLIRASEGVSFTVKEDWTPEEWVEIRAMLMQVGFEDPGE